MNIEVLGPLSIEHDGTSLVPTAGKPRQILALLALRAGHAVPVASLIEEVWGEAVPRSAATTLQTYILQLRRRIAAAYDRVDDLPPKEILTTTYGGYRLAVDSDSCDYRTFHDLVQRGSRALEADDALAASAHLGRALKLWRGPVLADVPIGPLLELEAVGMEEARLQALEQRITADLRLRRYGELIAELRVLTSRYPLNENFCAHLMTALYHSGSPWRALDEFRRLRACLHGELGVEPTSRLQRLHQAVLNGAPVPDGREARQLPAA
ncbi:AfsR/SARP family transcriptional regulator [Streptomyces sp. NPDC048417]|uniref:AfsR/SARP family transcriptional regulator n=1 Tax=Streptomyces sp. NPDC048417 TaxID=3155387 RepID=UPI00344A1614